ncbi:pyridoxal phosphate-dependent aminotransferase [Guggenheimella bovis]
MKISNRVLAMQNSPIRKLVPFAQEAKKKGTKVYHLNIGQPDIETPKAFFDAIKGFDQPVLAYALSQGSLDLQDALIGYFKRLGVEYTRDNVIVTNGGSEAIIFSLLATCDPGEEIVVFEPYYTNYMGFAAPYGVGINAITTSPENGFALPSKEEMLKKITPKTRAILVSNPSNPTGVVLSYDEVRMICDIAKEKDLFIIADEVYREFAYDGLEATSFASMADVEDRVIIIDSVSKRFSACGARIGCIISKNVDLMKNVMKLAMARLCVPTVEMIGATALYKLDPSYFTPIREEYQKRRDIMIGELQKIPGVLVQMPKGAFYAVVKLPVDSAEKFALWLLQDFSHNGETVMVAPAEGFYATEGLGVQEVRMAYVLEQSELVKAMAVLKVALEQYPGKTL